MKITLVQSELDQIKAQGGLTGEFVLALDAPAPAPPLPAIVPGHTVTLDPPYSVTGHATMFGLNWDGSVDTSDNGVGFFINPTTNSDYQTRSKTLVGCSLPREVMLSTFLGDDSWQQHGIDEAWMAQTVHLIHYVSNNQPLVTIDSGGHTDIGIVLVDAGPRADTHNAIDLTYAVAHQLGTSGNALATYMILVDDKPVQIRGWDFQNKRVIGS